MKWRSFTNYDRCYGQEPVLGCMYILCQGGIAFLETWWIGEERAVLCRLYNWWLLAVAVHEEMEGFADSVNWTVLVASQLQS